jgi:hypothetical protein
MKKEIFRERKKNGSNICHGIQNVTDFLLFSGTPLKNKQTQGYNGRAPVTAKKRVK